MKRIILSMSIVLPLILGGCSGVSDDDLLTSITPETTKLMGDADYTVIGIDEAQSTTLDDGTVETKFIATIKANEPLYELSTHSIHDVRNKQYTLAWNAQKKGIENRIEFTAHSTQSADGAWVTNAEASGYSRDLTALNDGILDIKGAKYKKIMAEREAKGYFFNPYSDDSGCSKDTSQTSPTSDFNIVDNGKHVIHKKTGLMWSRCVWGQKWSNKHSTCIGSDKRESVEWVLANKDNNSFSGNLYKNWRIPTIDELDTLVDRRCGFESINPEVFPNFPRDTHVQRAHDKVSLWSSTLADSGGAHFWTLNFADKYRSPNEHTFSSARNLKLVRNP